MKVGFDQSLYFVSACSLILPLLSVFKQPRRFHAPSGFVSADVCNMLQGQANIVEAVEQAVFAEWLYRKG